MLQRLINWFRSTTWYWKRYVMPVRVVASRSVFPHLDDFEDTHGPVYDFTGIVAAYRFARAWLRRYPCGQCDVFTKIKKP